MGKKQDNIKIFNMLMTMAQHPSFTVKVKDSKNVTNFKACEYSFPLGTVNPVPTHISVKNGQGQGFDIFFEFTIYGSYSLGLKIGDQEYNSLPLDKLAEIYKMSFNRIQMDKKINKTQNKFISYLQTSLRKRSK